MNSSRKGKSAKKGWWFTCVRVKGLSLGLQHHLLFCSIGHTTLNYQPRLYTPRVDDHSFCSSTEGGVGFRCGHQALHIQA